VIVMVQRYCWVFTLIVFAGAGWMTQVPTRLPHLRELFLDECVNVRYRYIIEILAAVPELELFEC
jgi:hypothetical protein